MSATLFKLPKVIAFDADGALMSGAKANFYITGTSTRQNTYTDKALSVAHDNPVVADGNGVFAPIYLDDTLNYKVDITDSLDASLTGYPVDDIASLSGLVVDLASTANAKGASLIGIEDAATNFLATDVEAALAEVYTDLASTANVLGASLIGIEDTAGDITATTVETALAEIIRQSGVTKFKASASFMASDITLADDADLAGWALTANKHYSIDAWLYYDQSVGNFKYSFQFSQTPQASSSSQWASDESATQYNDVDISLPGTAVEITTMTDGENVGLRISGFFQAHASTGGTLDFQWAQETSDTNNTTLKQGSWMRIARLD